MTFIEKDFSVRDGAGNTCSEHFSINSYVCQHCCPYFAVFICSWALSVSAGNGNSFLPVWVESVVYTESVLYVVSVQSPVPVVEKGLSLYSDDSFSVKAC